MARKSRARRLLAKQAPVAASLRLLRSAGHAQEMSKLQQGSPKLTSQARFDRVSGLSTPPKPFGWEGQGKLKNTRNSLVRVGSMSTKAHDRAMAQSLTSEFLAKGGKIV